MMISRYVQKSLDFAHLYENLEVLDVMIYWVLRGSACNHWYTTDSSEKFNHYFG